MRASIRYLEQAEAVTRLAAKAASAPERDVYLSIAEGWRKLAAEASRSERRAVDQPRFRDTLRQREG
jgi:hypothetical protein